MEVRRIFRAGNSLVVSLPQQALQALGLKEGSQVFLSVDADKKEIALRPFTENATLPVNGEFARVVEEFVREYAAVLKTLKR